MKVLFLGGSAFFGKRAVQMLADAGHQVGVFTRGRNPLPQHPEITAIQGDRNSLNDLKRVAQLASWDVVIDNIAFNALHVQQALSAFSNCGHYVLCSTVAVYRFISRPYPQPMCESDVDFDYSPPGEDPQDVHWAYARGKLEAERACHAYHTMPYTILRPPVVLGPEDPTERAFWYWARLLTEGPLLLADNGVQSFRLVYSEDTARALVQIVQNPAQVTGKAYFIAQKEVITLKDFVFASAKALGVQANTLPCPGAQLGAMAGPYASMVNLIPSIEAAQRDFGFEPTGFEQFIDHTVKWFTPHWPQRRASLLADRASELSFAQKWQELLRTLD